MTVKDIVGRFVLVKKKTELLSPGGDRSDAWLNTGSIVYVDRLIDINSALSKSYYIVIIDQDLKRQEVFYACDAKDDIRHQFAIVDS